MRVPVFGGACMLGSELVHVLSQKYEVHATARAAHPEGKPGPERCHGAVNMKGIAVVRSVLDRVKPAVVINAVGMVKQLSEQTPTEDFVEVNALFPHRLAQYCEESGIRLIHISTDCVFSGSRGQYAGSTTTIARMFLARSFASSSVIPTM